MNITVNKKYVLGSGTTFWKSQKVRFLFALSTFSLNKTKLLKLKVKKLYSTFFILFNKFKFLKNINYVAFLHRIHRGILRTSSFRC